jgi:excisionase family DNA binding protein
VPQRYQRQVKEAGEESEWLTLGRAAKYLGVAQSTIRKWSDSGRLPVFTTPGGHRRFRRRDIDEFVERSRPPAAPAQYGPRVLVVDDEPGIRAYVRASLEPQGCRVDEANGAEEGLRMTEARPHDLVMIDVVMPRVDGWQMLRRLRDRHDSEAVKVLMFSARHEGGEQLARSHGANGFIGKPLDPRRLVERARRTLQL